MKPTMSDIQEILKIFLESELQEVRLEIGDVLMAISRNGAAPLTTLAKPATAAAPTRPAPPSALPASEATPAGENWVAVTATSLGVIYRRPSPDQPPFVEVGHPVDENASVCLIEVMKMYNRVNAPCKGRIAAILVEDGKMVEFGQTLMYIDPA